VNTLVVKNPRRRPIDADSAPASAAPCTPLDGTVLGGRYLLSQEIGRGATGVVWDAQDLDSKQPVAVKVLHAALLSSPAAKGRFHREVRSAQALEHAHSVRVKAHGQTDDGGEFLVMERLRGRTLSAVLAETAPLPPLRAIRIVAQILDAMAAAHKENIVHRDLKPGNVILIDADGDPDFVKVCDFGLAKQVDPDGAEDDADASPERHVPSVTTGQGDLCGTPEYMAPEQARGEPLDARADLYSIAVILFQAIVGRVPFQGRTPFAVVGQHMGAPPPRPSALRPDLNIAPALENLIMRGLAKDRRERPSAAEVFRADLLQIERDLMRDQQRRSGLRNPSDAETLPSRPHARSYRRTGAPRIVLPVVAAAGLAAIVLGIFWKSSSSRHASSPAATVPGKQPVAAVAAAPSVARPPTRTAIPEADQIPVADQHIETIQARLPRRPRQVPVPSVSSTPPVSAAVDTTAPATPIVEVEPTPSVVVAADPVPDAETLLHRAEDLLAEGHVAKACALGETAAAEAPRSAPTHAFLGRCYTRVGRLDKAQASYRAYLNLAPDAPDAAFVRAIVDGKHR
jgi:serine/threonine protein kinase